MFTAGDNVTLSVPRAVVVTFRVTPLESGEGNGNPLQYSCPENPMDRGAWQAAVHGVAKSQTRLSDEHSHIPGKALEEADMENLVPSSIMGPPAQSSRELGGGL